VEINKFDISKENRLQGIGFNTSALGYMDVVKPKEDIGVGLAQLVVKGAGLYAQKLTLDKEYDDEQKALIEKEKHKHSIIAMADAKLQYQKRYNEYFKDKPEPTSGELTEFIDTTYSDLSDLRNSMDEPYQYAFDLFYEEQRGKVNPLIHQEKKELNEKTAMNLLLTSNGVTEFVNNFNAVALEGAEKPKNEDLFKTYTKTAMNALKYYESNPSMNVNGIYEQFPLLKPIGSGDVISDINIRADFDAKVADLKDKKSGVDKDNEFLGMIMNKVGTPGYDYATAQKNFMKKYNMSVLDYISYARNNSKNMVNYLDEIGDTNGAISLAMATNQQLTDLESRVGNIDNMYYAGNTDQAYKTFIDVAKAFESGYSPNNAGVYNQISRLKEVGNLIGINPFASKESFAQVMEANRSDEVKNKILKERTSIFTKENKELMQNVLAEKNINEELGQKLMYKYSTMVSQGNPITFDRFLNNFEKGEYGNQMFKLTDSNTDGYNDWSKTLINPKNKNSLTHFVENNTGDFFKELGINNLGNIDNAKVHSAFVDSKGDITLNIVDESKFVEYAPLVQYDNAYPIKITRQNQQKILDKIYNGEISTLTKEEVKKIEKLPNISVHSKPEEVAKEIIKNDKTLMNEIKKMDNSDTDIKDTRDMRKTIENIFGETKKKIEDKIYTSGMSNIEQGLLIAEEAKKNLSKEELKLLAINDKNKPVVKKSQEEIAKEIRLDDIVNLKENGYLDNFKIVLKDAKTGEYVLISRDSDDNKKEISYNDYIKKYGNMKG